MEQRNREFNRFNKIVEKVVETKFKIALKLHSYTYEIDQYSAWGSCPTATKSYTQALLMKDTRAKESKAETQELWF